MVSCLLHAKPLRFCFGQFFAFSRPIKLSFALTLAKSDGDLGQHIMQPPKIVRFDFGAKDRRLRPWDGISINDPYHFPGSPCDLGRGRTMQRKKTYCMGRGRPVTRKTEKTSLHLNTCVISNLKQQIPTVNRS